MNAYFRTIERLKSKEDFFARLYARRYRFMAHFGTEAGRPYDDLHKIYSEIVAAVRMLIMTYKNRNGGSDRKKWEASMGWAPSEHDKIPAQLDALVLEVEQICRPAIQEGVAATPTHSISSM